MLRQLTRRIGNVEPEVQERLRGLSIAQLEDLAEVLLDFTSATDLANWLRDRAPSQKLLSQHTNQLACQDFSS